MCRFLVCLFWHHTVSQSVSDIADAPRLNIKVRRVLKGHLAKIYAMHWVR